jgi:hypothetical protein
MGRSPPKKVGITLKKLKLISGAKAMCFVSQNSKFPSKKLVVEKPLKATGCCEITE